MTSSTALNNFQQTPGPQGLNDNALQLGGTVLQADGTQAAAIANPTDQPSNTTAIIAILDVMRNTGMIAT